MQQLLRLPEVCARIGLKRSSLYRMIEKGTFPQPVLIHEKAKGWPAEEVDAWIKARIAERDARTNPPDQA